MRRLLLLFVSALTLAGLFIAPAPASAAPGCASGWGSIPKVSRARTFAPLTGVRAGRHDCFDRLVLDIAGPVTGYHVGYVERVVMDGSGAPVPLRGDAFLSIAVYAPAHDDGFNPPIPPRTGPNSPTCGTTGPSARWPGPVPSKDRPPSASAPARDCRSRCPRSTDPAADRAS